jgi:hypothetical protein
MRTEDAAIEPAQDEIDLEASRAEAPDRQSRQDKSTADLVRDATLCRVLSSERLNMIGFTQRTAAGNERHGYPEKA